ncbi:MAG TPA: VOC family protein [Bryobacteraceae bacterium]|nr:VOC family protein [Bryobacteraceae bacterium]
MALIGAHMLLYSSEPEALRAMLRDVFGFPFVDAHAGWLIFALPPAELGVHPDEGPNFESGMRHEISFMCKDLDATILDLRAKGVQIDGEPEQQSYGTTIMMTLPGGVKVMLYEPRHKLAITPGR